MSKLPVLANHEICWIGKLDAIDFRGWSVGDGNVLKISYYDDSRDYFRVDFIGGKFNIIPTQGFGVQYQPTDLKQKRVNKFLKDKVNNVQNS